MDKKENPLIPIFKKMLLSDNLIDLSMKEIQTLKEFEEENINKLEKYINK